MPSGQSMNAWPSRSFLRVPPFLGTLTILALLIGSLVPGATAQAEQGQPRPAGRAPDQEEPVLEDIQLYSRATSRDCNGNGVADSVDIAEQTADDVNGNGAVDECDPDEAFNAHRYEYRDAWKGAKDLPDTSFFWSAHYPKRVVHFRYTVPPNGARVTLRVRNSSGQIINTLVNAKQPNGAYSLTWDRRSQHGILAPPGLYRFELKVGKRVYRRPGRWAI